VTAGLGQTETRLWGGFETIYMQENLFICWCYFVSHQPRRLKAPRRVDSGINGGLLRIAVRARAENMGTRFGVVFCGGLPVLPLSRTVGRQHCQEMIGLSVERQIRQSC